MTRDFSMYGIDFHLNDNNGDKYYESKYDLMYYAGRWMKMCTVDSLKEAKQYVTEHKEYFM